MAVPTRAEIDVLIRERLAADPGFRAWLVTDPREALSDIVSSPLPEFLAVTVHEESLTDVHLVLPPDLNDSISDDDLELVSGGNINWSPPCGP